MLSGSVEEDLSRVTTAKIGSLKEPYYSVPLLLSRLKEYKHSLAYSIWSTRDSNLATRLNAAIDNLETDVSDGALRKQPFCVMLYGYPGTGKSSFAIQIAKALMTDLYGEFNTSDMVTLNETDEYQSEFRTSHKVVLFDDIGASKYGLADTKNPWRKVIDFVNNIKKTALNPNVEMKGKVYIEPDLVILTSNLNFDKGFALINGYIPACEAIYRRLSKIVKVKDHVTVNPLDQIGLIPEIHESYCTRRPEFRLRGGSSPIDIPREEYIQELREAFRKHNKDQELFLEQFNGYFDDYTGHSNLPGEMLISQAGRVEAEDYLVPQSGQLDSINFDDPEEAEIRFYIRRVDWERYFIEHYRPLDNVGDGYARYFLAPEGIVVDYCKDYRYLAIDVNLFNEAYARIKENRSTAPGPIRAESKTVKDKLSSECAVVHTALQDDQLKRDKLLSLCAEMKEKWGRIDSLELEEILPPPFCNNFVLTRGANRPKQKTFYIAFAVYICAQLDIKAQLLYGSVVFTMHLPTKYVAKRDKHVATVNRKVNELKRYFPHLFDDDDDKSIHSYYSATTSSVVSQITEVLPDESGETVSKSMASITPWLDESAQIKYLLSTVKCSQSCQTMVNARFANFGEIDLLFIAPKTILVFELKSGIKLMSKAKHQALRYSRAMSALYPDKRIIGLTHTRIGFTMVCDLNASINTEFEGFLRMIGYLDNSIVVEQ